MHLKFFVRVLLAYDDIDTNEIPFSLDQIANATSTQLKGMIEVSLYWSTSISLKPQKNQNKPKVIVRVSRLIRWT